MAQLQQPTQVTIPATVGPCFSVFPGIRGTSTNVVTMRVAVSSNRGRAMCERQQGGGGMSVTSSTAPPTNNLVESHGDQAVAATVAENFPAFEVDIKKMAMVEDGGVEYFVKESGWKVRRLVEDGCEMREVARIQAEAFHEPVALFNDWFFYVFQAEVLSGLLYRLRNSPPNRYACLVAEPVNNESNDEDKDDGTRPLVGVVDLMVLRDSDVLRHLDGANQYLYVSGIAVSRHHRRKKVATALLKACEAISQLWGHHYLALRAYEDDWGARALYTNAGYRVVSGDPPWLGWIGRKRRILLVKRSSPPPPPPPPDDNNRLALPSDY